MNKWIPFSLVAATILLGHSLALGANAGGVGALREDLNHQQQQIDSLQENVVDMQDLVEDIHHVVMPRPAVDVDSFRGRHNPGVGRTQTYVDLFENTGFVITDIIGDVHYHGEETLGLATIEIRERTPTDTGGIYSRLVFEEQRSIPERTRVNFRHNFRSGLRFDPGAEIEVSIFGNDMDGHINISGYYYYEEE